MDDHRWFGKRVLARSVGLLDEADEARFREHLDRCASCASLWKDFTDAGSELADAPGHLPAAMVARWDRALRALRGIEREAALEHVEACRACREEIEAAGHVLGAEPAAGRPAHGMKPAAARRSWPPFLGGVLVGAAAAAVALLIALPQEETGSRALPWVVPMATRGSTPLDVPEGTREVLVAVPAPGPPEGMWVVEVFSPGGARLARERASGDAFSEGSLMLVVRGAPALATGSYRVTVRPEAAGDQGTELTFALRVAR